MYRRAISVSALVALVLGVGGGLSSAFAGKRATTASKAPYNIAVVASLTGAGSVNGIAGLAGATAAVDYINSTGIALIVSVLARARAERRKVVASGLSPHYREIFDITRLSDFIELFPDLDRAVSQLTPPAA